MITTSRTDMTMNNFGLLYAVLNLRRAGALHANTSSHPVFPRF